MLLVYDTCYVPAYFTCCMQVDVMPVFKACYIMVYDTCYILVYAIWECMCQYYILVYVMCYIPVNIIN